MNRVLITAAIVAAILVGGPAQAGVSGLADTVACTESWGGVSGTCQATLKVEALIPGISITLDKWDRLRWDCKVIRDGGYLVGSNTTHQNVPEREIGATWRETVTVKTRQNLPERQYCTRNLSQFYNNAAGPDGVRLLGWNAIDETDCIFTDPVPGQDPR